jgi:predicted nucleic acid-binding Zn ribbon protein
MKKLISHSTFHLKGSGWYVTDYASNRHGDGEKQAKADKDTTKKESKAASEKSKKEGGSSKPKGKKD